MANRKILHKRTSGNTPTPNMLSYGEIALNYGANKEALYLRSSTDKIVEIKTDDYNEKMFLMEDNKVFTTFETKEAYNAAIASGEIVAPNTSYIVDKNQFLSLSRIYQYNMKMVITQEWLNYWDENMTSQGVDHIYLCEFFNDDLLKKQTDGWEMMTGLTSDNIISFVVNDVECRHKFVTIPKNINLHPIITANNDELRVGYAIPRSEVSLGDVYDIHMGVVCEPFDFNDSIFGVLSFLDAYMITPLYGITMTEQLQGLVSENGYITGLLVNTLGSLQEIKYSGNFKISINMYTSRASELDTNYSYTPYLEEVNMGRDLTASGYYIGVLGEQEKLGITNPTLTVYLPNNNPTYGSPSDLWDGSTDSGKTAWGIHNYYLANKWNQSDFPNNTVDGPNLVAWKSNYTFNVVGYNDETYNG